MGLTIIAQSNEIVPLTLTIDREGFGGVTGLSPTVAIRDGSTTGSYLDWADSIFKPSGWTTKEQSMAD